jgi:hypothetical protein
VCILSDVYQRAHMYIYGHQPASMWSFARIYNAEGKNCAGPSGTKKHIFYFFVVAERYKEGFFLC